ncbi:hypothetical protein [Amycolatopsis samaneae]|uniref:Uncharacterized protein n=1 Tax=Amycolatopsis samaneae TaxID=664691 RepID=A0ABW5GTP3_9PSEU
METKGDIRAVEGLLVAADSPAGRAAAAINDLTMHLPTPAEPGVCPTCVGRFWPCRYFDDAAYRVHTARLRVGDVVPLGLHPRLWPPATPPGPSPGEEHDHG